MSGPGGPQKVGTDMVNDYRAARKLANGVPFNDRHPASAWHLLSNLANGAAGLPGPERALAHSETLEGIRHAIAGEKDQLILVGSYVRICVVHSRTVTLGESVEPSYIAGPSTHTPIPVTAEVAPLLRGEMARVRRIHDVRFSHGHVARMYLVNAVLAVPGLPAADHQYFEIHGDDLAFMSPDGVRAWMADRP